MDIPQPAPGAHTTPQYIQIVLYAAGHGLFVVVAAAVWGVWSLLSTFQEPLLWAWLISVALKDTKDWLVASLKTQLETRSLPGLVVRAVLFPVFVVKDTVHELGSALHSAVQEERQLQASVAATWTRMVRTRAATEGAGDHLTGSKPYLDLDLDGPNRALHRRLFRAEAHGGWLTRMLAAYALNVWHMGSVMVKWIQAAVRQGRARGHNPGHTHPRARSPSRHKHTDTKHPSHHAHSRSRSRQRAPETHGTRASASPAHIYHSSGHHTTTVLGVASSLPSVSEDQATAQVKQPADTRVAGRQPPDDEHQQGQSTDTSTVFGSLSTSQSQGLHGNVDLQGAPAGQHAADTRAASVPDIAQEPHRPVQPPPEVVGAAATLRDKVQDAERGGTEAEEAPSSRLFLWLFRVAMVQQVALIAMELDGFTLLLWSVCGLGALGLLMFAESSLATLVTFCQQHFNTWMTVYLTMTPSPSMSPAMSPSAADTVPTAFSLPTYPTTVDTSLAKTSNGVRAAVGTGPASVPAVTASEVAGSLRPPHAMQTQRSGPGMDASTNGLASALGSVVGGSAQLPGNAGEDRGSGGAVIQSTAPPDAGTGARGSGCGLPHEASGVALATPGDSLVVDGYYPQPEDHPVGANGGSLVPAEFWSPQRDGHGDQQLATTHAVTNALWDSSITLEAGDSLMLHPLKSTTDFLLQDPFAAVAIQSQSFDSGALPPGEPLESFGRREVATDDWQVPASGPSSSTGPSGSGRCCSRSLSGSLGAGRRGRSGCESRSCSLPRGLASQHGSDQGGSCGGGSGTCGSGVEADGVHASRARLRPGRCTSSDSGSGEGSDGSEQRQAAAAVSRAKPRRRGRTRAAVHLGLPQRRGSQPGSSAEDTGSDNDSDGGKVVVKEGRVRTRRKARPLVLDHVADTVATQYHSPASALPDTGGSRRGGYAVHLPPALARTALGGRFAATLSHASNVQGSALDKNGLTLDSTDHWAYGHARAQAQAKHMGRGMTADETRLVTNTATDQSSTAAPLCVTPDPAQVEHTGDMVPDSDHTNGNRPHTATQPPPAPLTSHTHNHAHHSRSRSRSHHHSSHRRHSAWRSARRAAVQLTKATLHALLTLAAWMVRTTFGMYSHADRWIRGMLVENLNAVVSTGLVIGTLLGMLCLAVVLVVQIGSEGHDAVVHMEAAVRGRATEAAAAAAHIKQSHLPGLLGAVEDQRRLLSANVEELQLKALSMVHGALPHVLSYVDTTGRSLIAKYNLTPFVDDMAKVYFSLPLSLNCSQEQHNEYSRGVAVAEMRLASARLQLDAADGAVGRARERWKAVQAAWEGAWLAAQHRTDGHTQDHRQGQEDTQANPVVHVSRATTGASTEAAGLAGAAAGSPAASGATGQSNHSSGDTAPRADDTAQMEDTVVTEGEKAGTKAGSPQTDGMQGGGQRRGEAHEGACGTGEGGSLQGCGLEALHVLLIQAQDGLQAAEQEHAAATQEVTVAQELSLFAARKLRACHALNVADSDDSVSRLATRCLQLVDRLMHADIQFIREELDLISGEASRLFSSIRNKFVSSSLVNHLSHPTLVTQLAPTLPTWVTNLISQVQLRAASWLGLQTTPRTEADHANASDPSPGSDHVTTVTMPGEPPITDQPANSSGMAGTASAVDDGSSVQAAGVAAGRTMTSHTNRSGSGANGSSHLFTIAGAAVNLGQQLGVAEGVAEFMGTLSSLTSSAFTSISGTLVALAGGTTALALDTGAAVYKAVGAVFSFAVDFGLFVATLMYLLSSGEDPLQRMIFLLPLDKQHQDMAGKALSHTMRAVFLSSLKLAFFHAGFTWVTLRAAGTHFTTLLTLISSLLAVLPLLPVWAPVVPAALELALSHGQYTGAIVLMAAQVLVSGYVDDVIMGEMGGGGYLTGFGVAGGMAVWSNPLKGVLLGPMCLALVSAAYHLHGLWVDMEGRM